MTQPTLRRLQIALAIVILGAGLYGGFGAWAKLDHDATARYESEHPDPHNPVEYNGHVYYNATEAAAEARNHRLQAYFPWLLDWSARTLGFILCVAFGVAGGASGVAYALLQSSRPLPRRIVWNDPMLGGLVGLMIRFSSLALDTFLPGDAPGILAGFSFFGGVFWKQAFAWIKNTWLAVFRGKPKKPEGNNRNGREGD